MNRHKVLQSRYLPTRLPLSLTVSGYIAIDYYHLPDIYKGILYTLMVIIWIISIGMKIMEKSIVIPEWDKED